MSEHIPAKRFQKNSLGTLYKLKMRWRIIFQSKKKSISSSKSKFQGVLDIFHVR